MLKVFVDNLEFIGRHGVYEEERRDGRRFQVDLIVELKEESAADSDELDQTLDYRHLAEIILEVGHGKSHLLVEKMAGAVLEAVFDRYPAVVSATITIRKFATGIPGDPRCVGIELTRRRS
ncbi:MAG: dihydroneopterin aldolase [Bradymonadaceae bacterium]